MKLGPIFLGLVALAAVDVLVGRDAGACGGCFVSQSESTQVSGHRMALSISKQQTTLWDQISYSGDPAEFAWVLPIRGQVDVALSSDLLFETLDQTTKVTISSPPLNCGVSSCFGAATSSNGGFSSGAGGSGGVSVIAQEVVGPYETVQLKSTDPKALDQWLSSHGYAVPADVTPVIDAYVAEGFDFLAIRLLPGQGIAAMRPVRVTMPGASPSLPLRMVAAGTGAVTPITLWVIGEGRYEPASMPSFLIDPKTVVWNWDTQSSNYATLRQAGFDASLGAGWLIEDALPESSYLFQGLVSQATEDPGASGYADASGLHAAENAASDVGALTAGIPANGLWVTRMSAELTRPALAKDLTIAAAHDQAVPARRGLRDDGRRARARRADRSKQAPARGALRPNAPSRAVGVQLAAISTRRAGAATRTARNRTNVRKIPDAPS